MQSLQNHPHILEKAYTATFRLLYPLRRWLKPGGGVERVFILGERVAKGTLFDCRMCGQCVLHNTGMTCPMTCPKSMRNGPCGGVRRDGQCEIKPEMLCVWTRAWERSAKMPLFGVEIRRVLPPIDHRLEGTSAWLNELTGLADSHPAGWDE